MPSKTEKQRNYIFYLRSKYGSESNTPESQKWIWEKGWEEIKEKELEYNYKYKPNEEDFHTPQGENFSFVYESKFKPYKSIFKKR